MLYFWVVTYDVHVSEISKVEVLGFSKLTDSIRHQLEMMIEVFTIFPVSSAVINQATQLRSQKKMSLGDSIVAGTAIVYGLPLMTRNDTDFNWIDGLNVI